MIYMLDEEKNGELVKTTENLEFTLSPYSVVLIREICSGEGA